jgi:hypothetical protein
VFGVPYIAWLRLRLGIFDTCVVYRSSVVTVFT